MNIRIKIEEYLANHAFASLATVFNGKPRNAKIRYASIGLRIYFATMKKTDKVEGILQSPHVALVIDNNSTDNFLQYYGVASVIENVNDIKMVVDVLSSVYKYSKYWHSEKDVMYFVIQPKCIKFTMSCNRNPALGKYFGDVYILDELLLKGDD